MFNLINSIFGTGMGEYYNYNSEIPYWGGETRPKEINGNYWTFHDPHTGNRWGVMENGRNSYNYDKIWDWLLNIK